MYKEFRTGSSAGSSKKTALLSIAVILPLILNFAGCDDNFIPIEENDRYIYSIYGYLDVEADTQWIRVMPVRETIYYSTDPIDATVTLTNLSTSQTVAMNDSLFQIDVPGTEDDIAFWNFWTAEPLDGNTQYEIRAARSDGKASSVRVHVPPAFPTPAVDFDFYEFLEVTNVETVADVRTFWQVYNPARGDTNIYQFNHTYGVRSYGNGTSLITLSQSQDWEIIQQRNRDAGTLHILHAQISIVSAGDDWINFPEMDKEVIALPEATSNIENGAGYVVGAAIKVIPYASCWDYPDDPNRLIPCPTEPPMWK